MTILIRYIEIGESRSWPGAYLFLASDYGSILCRGKKWWASNDNRTNLIGIFPNEELIQPTIGPFNSKEEAIRAYDKIHF